MKKLAVSLVVIAGFVNVSFAKNITKKELSLLEKQNVPNYCLLINSSIIVKKRNPFGRIVEENVPSWINFLADDIVKEKNLEKRKKRIFSFVAFITYKSKKFFNDLQEYIKSHQEGVGGATLHFVGMRSYLKSTLGFGTLPIYKINIANYASKKMKIEGEIDYVKLGLLLDKTLLLGVKNEEEFVDRFLLLNSYLLTYVPRGISELFQSLFVSSVFDPSVIEKAYGHLYNFRIPLEFMIETFTRILVKSASNPRVNALIYHLIKEDAIDFMLKDKKVLKKYKVLKSIYLQYKKAKKC